MSFAISIIAVTAILVLIAALRWKGIVRLLFIVGILAMAVLALLFHSGKVTPGMVVDTVTDWVNGPARHYLNKVSRGHAKAGAAEGVGDGERLNNVVERLHIFSANADHRNDIAVVYNPAEPAEVRIQALRRLGNRRVIMSLDGKAIDVETLFKLIGGGE